MHHTKYHKTKSDTSLCTFIRANRLAPSLLFVYLFVRIQNTQSICAIINFAGWLAESYARSENCGGFYLHFFFFFFFIPDIWMDFILAPLNAQRQYINNCKHSILRLDSAFWLYRHDALQCVCGPLRQREKEKIVIVAFFFSRQFRMLFFLLFSFQ